MRPGFHNQRRKPRGSGCGCVGGSGSSRVTTQVVERTPGVGSVYLPGGGTDTIALPLRTAPEPPTAGYVNHPEPYEDGGTFQTTGAEQPSLVERIQAVGVNAGSLAEEMTAVAQVANTAAQSGSLQVMLGAVDGVSARSQSAGNLAWQVSQAADALNPEYAAAVKQLLALHKRALEQGTAESVAVAEEVETAIETLRGDWRGMIDALQGMKGATDTLSKALARLGLALARAGHAGRQQQLQKISDGLDRIGKKADSALRNLEGRGGGGAGGILLLIAAALGAAALASK